MPQPKNLFQPWAPPRASLPDVVAVKALAQGSATPDQQKRALHFIIVDVCKVDDEPFCPGVEGQRATDYALGKRRVATYLRSLLSADIRQFKKGGEPSEQVE